MPVSLDSALALACWLLPCLPSHGGLPAPPRTAPPTPVVVGSVTDSCAMIAVTERSSCQSGYSKHGSLWGTTGFAPKVHLAPKSEILHQKAMEVLSREKL